MRALPMVIVALALVLVFTDAGAANTALDVLALVLAVGACCMFLLARRNAERACRVCAEVRAAHRRELLGE